MQQVGLIKKIQESCQSLQVRFSAADFDGNSTVFLLRRFGCRHHFDAAEATVFGQSLNPFPIESLSNINVRRETDDLPVFQIALRNFQLNCICFKSHCGFFGSGDFSLQRANRPIKPAIDFRTQQENKDD